MQGTNFIYIPTTIPEEYKDHYHLTAENFVKATQGEEVEYSKEEDQGEVRPQQKSYRRQEISRYVR